MPEAVFKHIAEKMAKTDAFNQKCGNAMVCIQSVTKISIKEKFRNLFK